MKKLFVLICVCLFLVGCQSEADLEEYITPTLPAICEDVELDAHEPVAADPGIHIFPVTRKDVGWDAVPPIVDLDISIIHPDIIEAIELISELAQPGPLQMPPDILYQRGIEVSPRAHSRYIAVSNRWAEYVLGDITMSSTRDDVIALMGEPSWQFERDDFRPDHAEWIPQFEAFWALDYRTEQYLISFQGLQGSDVLEYVFFYPAPPLMEPENRDILLTILNDATLYPDWNDFWNGSWESEAYLGYTTRLHGGIEVASTTDGIRITWLFTHPDVFVSANFEGNLYQATVYGEELVRFLGDENLARIRGISRDHRVHHSSALMEHTSTDGRYSMRNTGYNLILIHDNSGMRNPFYVNGGRILRYGWVENSHQIWLETDPIFHSHHGNILHVVDATTPFARIEVAPESLFYEIIDRPRRLANALPGALELDAEP